MTTRTSYTETYVLQIKSGDDWVDEFSGQSVNAAMNHEASLQFSDVNKPGFACRIIKRTVLQDITEEEVDYF